VTFAGEVADAARLLAAFDVFAAPSRKEGLPLAVVEAMALGLPVVASDIPAHREALGFDSEGLVAGTAEAFAARLTALMDDADLRARLGAENRTRARSQLDVRDMVTALEAVYREALGL
jgi:glycosyltransferase involved in cell wall biosynthesis